MVPVFRAAVVVAAIGGNIFGQPGDRVAALAPFDERGRTDRAPLRQLGGGREIGAERQPQNPVAVPGSRIAGELDDPRLLMASSIAVLAALASTGSANSQVACQPPPEIDQIGRPLLLRQRGELRLDRGMQAREVSDPGATAGTSTSTKGPRNAATSALATFVPRAFGFGSESM